MIRLLLAMFHRLRGREVCPTCRRAIPPTTRLRFAGFGRDGYPQYACAGCVGAMRIVMQAKREAW